MKNNLVVVSGGFDPLHVGHARMINEAALHGDVVVLLNSDAWLERKKGYVFMPFEQRAEILSSLQNCLTSYSVDDSDGTVCRGLEYFASMIGEWEYDKLVFANGGDRKEGNVPEYKVCEDLGIEMLFGIGGNEKPNSSSWMVENAWVQKLNKAIP